MTTTDKIALIAAIAAGFSAAIALAAVFVAWSARKDSKRSADAAQRANDLMAQQLELAKEERNLNLQKERSESHPFLNWQGGSCSPAAGICNWDFQNIGAMVTDVKIQSDTKGISASVSPTNTLLNNSNGKITFTFEKTLSQNLALPIVFSISCITKLGERWTRTYNLVGERFPERVVEI